MLLRKYRIISPLWYSICASAWQFKIIALAFSGLSTLQQVILDLIFIHTVEPKEKAKAGWSLFRVFLPSPALFLCKQWLGGGSKSKMMTEGNHWGHCGCPSVSDNWEFAATVWSLSFRSRFSLLGRNHHRIPGEMVPLLKRRKEVSMQNYWHGCVHGQNFILTLRLAGQPQLGLTHIWGVGVATVSRQRLTSFAQLQKMLFCAFWWVYAGPPVSPVRDGQTGVLRAEIVNPQSCSFEQISLISSHRIHGWWWF